MLRAWKGRAGIRERKQLNISDDILLLGSKEVASSVRTANAVILNPSEGARSRPALDGADTEQFLSVLLKDPANRTDDDIDDILAVLEGVDFIKSLSDPARRDIARHFQLRRLGSLEAAVLQGEEGGAHFLLLAGSALCCRFADEADAEEMLKHFSSALAGDGVVAEVGDRSYVRYRSKMEAVAVFRPGKAFGEASAGVAPGERARRVASVITLTPCDVAWLPREVHERALGAQTLHGFAIKEAAIRTHPLLRDLPEAVVHRLAESSTVTKYPARSVIAHEGHEAEHLFVVLRGEVSLTKRFTGSQVARHYARVAAGEVDRYSDLEVARVAPPLGNVFAEIRDRAPVRRAKRGAEAARAGVLEDRRRGWGSNAGRVPEPGSGVEQGDRPETSDPEDDPFWEGVWTPPVNFASTLRPDRSVSPSSEDSDEAEASLERAVSAVGRRPKSRLAASVTRRGGVAPPPPAGRGLGAGGSSPARSRVSRAQSRASRARGAGDARPTPPTPRPLLRGDGGGGSGGATPLVSGNLTAALADAGVPKAALGRSLPGLEALKKGFKAEVTRLGSQREERAASASVEVESLGGGVEARILGAIRSGPVRGLRPVTAPAPPADRVPVQDRPLTRRRRRPATAAQGQAAPAGGGGAGAGGQPSRSRVASFDRSGGALFTPGARSRPSAKETPLRPTHLPLGWSDAPRTPRQAPRVEQSEDTIMAPGVRPRVRKSAAAALFGGGSGDGGEPAEESRELEFSREGPGGHFGECSILGLRHEATATTTAPTEVLSIARPELASLLPPERREELARRHERQRGEAERLLGRLEVVRIWEAWKRGLREALAGEALEKRKARQALVRGPYRQGPWVAG